MKRTGPSNTGLKNLIVDFSKQESPLWKRLAKELSKPARSKMTVNLYKIDKYTREGEIAVVPGKVLSLGNLSKKLTIAALSFSESAKEKIKASGSKALMLNELLQQKPKKVRLLK